MSDHRKQNEKYHTHISAKHKLFDLKLSELFRYKDLILLFTKRSVTVQYKQTVLGPLWLFLNPFLTSLMYMVVFGNIAKLGTEGVPQILFYLTGSAVWGFFSACLVNNAATFTGNAHLFGKVYFPRLAIPVSNVLSGAIRFAVQMILVLAFLGYYVAVGQVSPHWWAWLAIPLVLLQLGLLGMGLGVVISSVTTKYRDLSVLVGFGVQLWMYATPVVYPLSTVGDGILKTALLLNPVTPSVELFRYAILGQGTVDIPYLFLSWGVTAVLLFLGIIVFNRVERTFMDTV